MRRQGGELGPRRQQRGEVKDALDFELGEHPLEQLSVVDGTGEFAADQRRERGIERADIERNDAGAGGRQAGHQRVSNFAAGAGDEHDRFSHARDCTSAPARSRCRVRPVAALPIVARARRALRGPPG
jgi:hypothetical protein